MDVGVEINQYYVVEHIGRGGMADVWSARDRRLNRTVAIKTVARDLSSGSDAQPVELFEREAQTVAQLEHPHILPIYDFGEFEGQLYIVMRYVTGGSLEDLLSAGPLTVTEALRMARAVGNALDHAHANHVVHLDIKPSNILLDSNRSPYLADFGLATVVGPEGRAANPGYGTLLYMAPEQLTADAIDHRADIYAFTILVFHMLTGELPFDATTSLALKQLQFQEDLPNLDAISPDLPPALTPILRRGTALDLATRPNSLKEFIEDLEEALLGYKTVVPDVPSGTYLTDNISMDSTEIEIGATIDVSDVLQTEDAALREAHDLYSKARRAWAFGQGRFLMGITHFMLVNDYYMNAQKYTLNLDEAGKQMLLRGALEYDHEVDYWWSQLDDENRRWVTLHAIRSDSAPARVRALYRLETLPDSDPPKIPGLVAQALQVERDEAAMRAAIHVLTTRAQLMLRTGYQLADEVSGKMLNTQARVGLQRSTPSVWREKVYSSDIDLLLADTALESPFPAIAEQAARAVGRIRSLTAVRAIAEQQRQGKKYALRALALVRDEAPFLPPVVSPQGRFYAWLDNTWRRLSDKPMGIVWRYVFAFLSAFAGMSIYAWINLSGPAILINEIIGRTLSTGITFGVFMGVVVILAGEFPLRLRGFWTWWSSLIAGIVLGTLSGAFVWAMYSWLLLYLELRTLDWNPLLFGGFGIALGLTLSSIFSLRGWQAAILTTITIFVPIYITYTNFMPPIVYFREQNDVFTQGIMIALLIAIGSHAQALWIDIQRLITALRQRSKSQVAAKST
jgi:aminoglycoside phosphotransferase (APT) family kinase protein